MSRNLANEFNTSTYAAVVKRLRKANKYAKQIAHGGWGEEAKNSYLQKYPEAESK